MSSSDRDPLDSILLNIQIISIDSSRAAEELVVVGQSLGDELLHIAANFVVAHLQELKEGRMPDQGLFKWLAREYPPLPPHVEAACRLYIEDVCRSQRCNNRVE